MFNIAPTLCFRPTFHCWDAGVSVQRTQHPLRYTEFYTNEKNEKCAHLVPISFQKYSLPRKIHCVKYNATGVGSLQQNAVRFIFTDGAWKRDLSRGKECKLGKLYRYVTCLTIIRHVNAEQA